MKVLFVVFEFQEAIAGGLGRVINGVSRELARSVELHVLALFRRPYWLYQLQLYTIAPNGRATKRGRPVLDGPAQFARLLQAEGGYDVVHFFYANEAIMSSKLRVLREHFPASRLVYSVHNLFRHERHVRPCSSSFLRAEAQMLDAVDHVHVLNQACLEVFRRTYPEVAARTPISVIYNALDPSGFAGMDAQLAAQLERRLPRSSRIIACVSRWAPGKGLEHLVEAARELLAEGRDVCLVLAGRKGLSWEKGSFSYVRRVDRQLAALGGRALSLGWLSEAQRNALFARADAAVMPSELEYFPYGATEPLYLGAPLVQSRLPCLTELFEHRQHCRFFEPRDSRSLAEQLRVLLDDPAGARRMAAAGRERVRELPRWPAIARRYASMYELMAETAPVRALRRGPELGPARRAEA